MAREWFIVKGYSCSIHPRDCKLFCTFTVWLRGESGLYDSEVPVVAMTEFLLFSAVGVKC